MQYLASKPFRGDAGKAFGLAESALTALGFQIKDRTPTALEMTGPGMTSNRESGLLGASRIHVYAGGGELALDADLGGVAFLSRFVTLFPPGLCLFLAVVLSVAFSLAFGPGAWLVPVLVPTGLLVVLWVFLGPLMARGIRAKTDRALDALLANMVVVGESA